MQGLAFNPRGTRPELTPVEDHYRIDINVSPPVVDEADWRLRITGLVEQPLELTLEELRTNYEPTHQFITLACISNRIGGGLISTTRWTGVSLQRLLEHARIRPDATHLRIRSADDFHETLGLDVVRADERVMLTYEWDGLPLAIEHGFPLRVYIPDRFGMKQPKWIESIEAIAEWEPGYWVQRGWDREARMVATSVIDTVATDMMLVDATNRTLIPIGGIAHAGARGISRVEVKVDDGQWQQARLREPLSDLRWVIWRFDWPFQSGRHTFTVRCFERDGTPQIATDRPIRPSGATGLFDVREML
jgi:DMSO/TMAO reductase YedYZ molybdopterin-dependent catalytic subunit